MKTSPHPNPTYPIGTVIGCRSVVDTKRFLTAKTAGASYWRERVRLGCPKGHVTWYQVWYIAKLLAGQAPDCCAKCTPRSTVNRSDLAVPRIRAGRICHTCCGLPERRKLPMCPECKQVPAREVLERSSGYIRTEDALGMAS